MKQNSTRWATIIASRVSRQKTRFFIAIADTTFAHLLVLIQLGFEGALYDSAKIPYRNLNADLMIGNTRSQTRFDFLYAVFFIYSISGTIAQATRLKLKDLPDLKANL